MEKLDIYFNRNFDNKAGLDPTDDSILKNTDF